jgi:hypothetical protein
MIVGDLLLRMAGNPYYGPPMARASTSAKFTVQISNTLNSGALILSVAIEHRNQEDTSWAVADTFANIAVDGVFSKEITGLKELLRFKYTFTAGAATDGMCVFASSPQWLRD